MITSTLTPRRRWFILCLFLVGPASLVWAQQPNVILVITDDQGYGDIAAHGNPQIETPHLDALRAYCFLLHRRLEELSASGSRLLEDLSPRERDVISLVVQGATRKEVARQLGISPNTMTPHSSQ